MRSLAALTFVVAALIAVGATVPTWAQDKVVRIGMLVPTTTDEARERLYQPFRATLASHGWIEGKNLVYEYRAARGDAMQYDQAAAELVQLKVDVLYADSAPATRAAYAVTRTIPIVALDYTNDPVAAGYARSYATPGYNLTGFFLDAPQFAAKWLELLQATVPALSKVGVVWDPRPGTTHLEAIQKAAPRLGLRLTVVQASKPDELKPAIAALRGRVQALVILPSPMMLGHSVQLGELTAQARLPTASFHAQLAEAGALFAYGPDDTEAGERCGLLVAKILNGAKPGSLPVERPTRFAYVVNLHAAKTLGVSVPESILAGASRVIR